MPDLLLEILSEEIPARMQAQAAADLQRLVEAALAGRGLRAEGARALAGPRRLSLHLAGLPARQPDLKEEKKGPRVGAPEAAVAGFLKAAGLSSVDEAQIETDAKKGSFYVAVVERKGRATIEILAEIMPGIFSAFPWPKSMRWGAQSTREDALRWVRPLHSIVCTFGPETEEPDVVAFSAGGISSGNVTRGHRFMAPGEIVVKRFDDYVAKLDRAKVIADPARRRDIIRADARDLALAHGFEVVEDEALLAEVAGLVEWPVVLAATFDESFLELPAEVIRATIRANQKCFVLKKPDGKLANTFILVSNIIASDGGAAVAAGNARVVRARLSDAQFFWTSDLKVRLEDRLPKLDAIVFHEKLGTQGERVKRIVALAREIAPLVGADVEQTARAALLCKADLVTEMVGEFPELQGLMGRYYAQAQGEAASVAVALEDHYKPQGPGDRVPTDKVAIAVGLADKIDTLVGFWAIDEKPTGSKDPYALRRAALGVIRIVIENGERAHLNQMIRISYEIQLDQICRGNRLFGSEQHTDQGFVVIEPDPVCRPNIADTFRFAKFFGDDSDYNVLKNISKSSGWEFDGVLWHSPHEEFRRDLLTFFIDRLKVYLRDKGARHDLIDAVLSTSSDPHPNPQTSASTPQGGGAMANDDLVLIVRRVEALGAFLATDDGKTLLAGYKRAANILRAEEKSDKAGAVEFSARHEPNLRIAHEEHMLAAAIDRARTDAGAAVAAEDFAAAMRALAKLRTPVDAFFEKVTVNDADPKLRLNRLRLLNELRRATLAVADFSKIAG